MPRFLVYIREVNEKRKGEKRQRFTAVYNIEEVAKNPFSFRVWFAASAGRMDVSVKE